MITEIPQKDGSRKRIVTWTDDFGASKKAEVMSDERYGDRIVVGEFRCWYVSYESEHGRKQVKGYTDKAASIALGDRLEKEAARRREGLIDQFDEHMKTPILTHLADFMVSRQGRATSHLYIYQVQTRIERIIAGIKATRLHELDVVAIDRFLTAEKLEGHTRNEYISNIKAFSRWAFESKRLRDDPLALLRKVPKGKIKVVHPRRALSLDQLSQLLDAAVRRPLLETMTVRTGKNQKQQIANVHPRVQAKMNRLGQERKHCYLIAYWAGLRRSEVKALRWSDIKLDSEPLHIQLRAEATKAKRPDPVALHPQLVEALRAARHAETKPEDRVVRTVPDMKTFRADLRLAGIDEGTQETGFVDFHSLRKTISTQMAIAKVSQRVRQSHMRHTNPSLTENTYMDQRLLPVAQELATMPWILDAKTPASTGENTASTAPVGAPSGAPIAPEVHRKAAVLTLDLSSDGNASQEEIIEMVIRGPRSQVLQIQGIVQVLSRNDKTPHR
ncbi:MAG: tyrosine-type recombinase/integrase [Phycisphaerales bacterium]|nr:tyrosine-type recombinase/integrase [Phycisphaerales bacterium]